MSKTLEQAIRSDRPEYFDVNTVAGQIVKLDNLAETLYDIKEMPIDGKLLIIVNRSNDLLT